LTVLTPIKNIITHLGGYINRSQQAKFPQKPIQDVFSKTKRYFTTIEKDLMEILRPLRKEDARVLDAQGELIKELKFIGDEYSCRIDPKVLMNDIGLIERIKGGTLIHNHVFEAVLSMEDLSNLFSKGVRKVIATTPGGGHSFIELPKNFKLTDKIGKKAGKLYLNEQKQIKKLLKNPKLTNEERWILLNQWRIKQFEGLTRKDGFIFEYQPGEFIRKSIDLSSALQ